MRAGFKIALAALLILAAEPAFAQTAGTTMPPGTQNPAVAQPRLVAPPQSVLSQPAQNYQPGPQPGGPPQPSGSQPSQAYQPGPQPGEPSPGALIVPGDAGGLCECVVNHDRAVSPFDKTKMHQSCLASVAACQSACNTDHSFSFVPHAIYTCPGGGEGTGRVAASASPVRRLASAR